MSASATAVAPAAASRGVDWSAVPSRGVLRNERTDDEWRERRRAPKTSTRVRFIIPEEPAKTSADGSLRKDGPFADDDIPAAPALHMTDEERRQLGLLPDDEQQRSQENTPPGPTGAGTGTASAGESSDTFESDVAAIEAAVDAVAATYTMNPVTLTFTDPELEKAYVKFFTRHQGFIAGKIYAALAGIIAVGLLFPYLNFEMTAERWGQVAVVVELSGVAVGWLMFGLMFLRQTLEVRELIFFMAVATHWPAFATGTLIAKVDKAYRYAYTTLCFMFCCFVAQPRFVGMFFFLTVSPLATCFIATFTKTDYWEEHSYFEMLYWVMPLFSLLMLRIFERRSREAFMENERGLRAMEVLQHRANLTRRIIARFFPLSASRRLLATGGAEQNTVYPATALIVTDVVGFTEWAAQTSAELVVSRVATMFVTMERLGRRYGVEKVSTLGDLFFGAIFPLETREGVEVARKAHAPSTTAASATPLDLEYGPSPIEEHARSLNLEALRLPCRSTAAAGDDDADETGTLNSKQSYNNGAEQRVSSRLVRAPSALRPRTGGGAAEDSVNQWLTEAQSFGVSHDDYSPQEDALLDDADEDDDDAIAAVKLHEESTSNDAMVAPAIPPVLRRTTSGRGSNHGSGTGSGRGSASTSNRTSLPTVDRDTADRCHRALRFATAVRHHKSVMALQIAVHCGSVIGGFVGIQPPKFDLFGPAVRRVKELGQHSRKRRIHASEEIITLASPFGHPSADFEPSDCRAQLFSSWRTLREGEEAPLRRAILVENSTTAANGTGVRGVWAPLSMQLPTAKATDASNDPSPTVSIPVDPASPTVQLPPAAHNWDWDRFARETEDVVQEKALVLCAYLQRFGEREKEKAMRGFESREALLKLTMELDAAADGSAAAQQGDGLPDGSPSAAFQMQNQERSLVEQLEREMAELEIRSDCGPGSGGVSSIATDDLMINSNGAMREPLLGEDEVLQIENPGDELALYKMDILRMRFEDPKVEAQYLLRMRNQQFTRDVYLTFAMMTLYLLFADVANACVTSTVGRLRPLLIGVYVLWHILYLYYVGTGHRYNILVVLLTYSGLSWVAALMYDPACTEPTAVVSTAGNIIAMYFNQLAIAPTFAVDVWMFTRWAILVGNAIQFVAAIAVRRAVWADEVLLWDGLPLAFCAAFMFTSLFAELSLRSGFQATMRRRALHTNRSEHAERTAEALEMMLPTFVIEKLMRVAKKAGLSGDAAATVDMDCDAGSHHSHESGATRLSLASALSRNTAGSRGSDHTGLIASDVAHSMLTRQSEAVWPYPRAVVLVVSFKPPVLAYDSISDTVMRVEAVARARGIQKVKSFGKTVQLVSGFDKGLQFQEAVVNALDAALEIQRRVFPPHLTDGWTHHIGIHCGPIFGAVIGTRGLSFDIYGDTVNTAAILEQSAPSNTIRCSANVRQALPFDDSDLDFVLTRIAAPVLIKGKGHVAVYHVVERGRAPQPRQHAAGSAASVVAPGVASTPERRMLPDDDEEVEEHPNPSEIAESIRSSLRSAAMLPSAAAPIVSPRDPPKNGNRSRDEASDTSSDAVTGGAPLDTPTSALGPVDGFGSARCGQRAAVQQHADPAVNGQEIPMPTFTGAADVTPPRSESATPQTSGVRTFRPRVFDSPGDALQATAEAAPLWGRDGSLHYDDDIAGFSDEDE